MQDTKIRVFLLNNNNVDVDIVNSKISKLVEDLRINVEIQIINFAVEQEPFYSLIKRHFKPPICLKL